MKYFGLLIFFLLLTVPHIPAQEKKAEQGKIALHELQTLGGKIRGEHE